MDLTFTRSQRGKKIAYHASELDARMRNKVAEESLRTELSTLSDKERQSVRLLRNQTRNFLDSIQSVKLGRRKVSKSLTRNHVTPLRSRSGSLSSACPQPRTCLADSFCEDEFSNDTETVKLPSIHAGPSEKYRSPMRPSSSALQRRRFSENDALVESLRRFHALRISSQTDELDPSSASQPALSHPPKKRVRGRSGSCFGRLISSPIPNALEIKSYKTGRDDDTDISGDDVDEVESKGTSDNDITLSFMEPSVEYDCDTKSNENKSIDDSYDKEADLTDDKETTNDEINLQQIVPQIVITEYEDTSSSVGNSENLKERKDGSLLCAQVKKRPSRPTTAKSDWSRNRPLREARKKNMALLPSTFAALSMSRRFSSPDPAEDAVRAHQMFLEKLNRRRRSEQTELAQRVKEFLKQTTASSTNDFTKIDAEVSLDEM